jgi:hypothetical protein
VKASATGSYFDDLSREAVAFGDELAIGTVTIHLEAARGIGQSDERAAERPHHTGEPINLSAIGVGQTFVDIDLAGRTARLIKPSSGWESR